MSIKDHPLVIFLAGIVAAFVAGIAAYEFLEAHIKAELEQAVGARLARLEVEVGKVEARSAAAHERLNHLKLSTSAPADGPTYGCGGHDQATGESTFMIGLRDGTSCGVPNLHTYRTISLTVPPE